jgi:hypothetical protein
MEGLNLSEMVCAECGCRVDQTEGGWEHVPPAGDGLGRHDPQPVDEGTYRVNKLMRETFGTFNS